MNAVAEHIPAAVHTAMAVPAPQSDALLVMMERALTNPEIPTDKLNALMKMRMEWDDKQRSNAKEDAAEQARLAFIAAMVEFKKRVPAILKDKHVEFNTSKGVTSYDHETIGAVCEAVIPVLADVGITHSWPPQQNGREIAVTCVLEHVGGHTKEVTLKGGPEESGTKNAIQSVASAIKYFQRYSLLLACGLASKHVHDDDGRLSGGEPAKALQAAEKIVPPEGYHQWADNLRAVCDEGRQKLLKVWKDSLMERRAFMTKHEPNRWDGMKKLAEGVSKKLAAEGVQS